MIFFLFFQDTKPSAQVLFLYGMFFSHELCDKVWAPYSLSCTTATISFILFLITIPGNLLICISMLKDPFHELRTPFNYFVLNLAISDLIVGTITEPAFIVFHIREALRYPVLETIWLVHLAYFIACMASLLSLSALTIDRYLTITSMYKRVLKLKRVIAISVFIWLISIAVPCLYFITGFYLFAFIFANTAIVVTLCIVSFAYIRVYLRLRTQVIRWGSLNQRQMKNQAIVFERKLTKSFLLILGFFTICLIPSCIINYFLSFCGSCDCTIVHWLRDVQFLLTLINCSSNQFLYATRMSRFRRAFVNVLNLDTCLCFEIITARRRGLVQIHQRELIEIRPLADRSRSDSEAEGETSNKDE